ncbi:MAG: AMP-binding protein [Alphaproteobacteria bacterium]
MKLIPLSSLLIEGRPDNHPVALRRGELILFSQFRADVEDAAARFKDYRRVALVCHDSYNFIVGFYGLLHAGATIVLPPNGQSGTLQALKDEFNCLVDDAVVEDGQGKTAILTPIDPMRPCLVFLTSGSTGTPKKIIKNLAMPEREIMTLDALWGQTSGAGPVFATVSHQHIYGLTFKLLWPLMAGRIFTTEMHALWESLFSTLTPDAVIVSSPAHLDRLGGVVPISLQQSPKRIFSAGAPLSLRASQQTEQVFGCRPTEIFGSTETGAFATRSQINGDEPWRLLPGMEMRCDANSRLVIRSPFIGEDWLETADLIEPVADGFISLGRADRIAKIEGKRVALAQVEQSLEQLSLVRTAAVIVLQGNPDCLVAAIVPSEEGQARLSELGNFRFGRLLRSHLATTQEAAGIPRLWRFMNELPMQGMGKRRDADIRTLFRGGA